MIKLFQLWCLLIGIFFLPFVVSFDPQQVNETARVWFFLRIVEVLGFLSLFTVLNEKTNRVWKPGVIILLCVYLAALVSSFTGVNLEHSWVGNYYRFDGLIILTHLVAFSLWVAFLFKKEWSGHVLQSISFSVLILAAITIFQGLTDWGRPVGLAFAQPNFLAGYLLVCLPTLWYFSKLFPAHLRKTIFLSTALMTVLAIVLTQSWGAALGIVLFGVLVWIVHDKKRLKLIFPGTLFFIFIFSLSAYLYFKDTHVAESRERLVRKLVPAIAARPLLGWGWANVDSAFESTIWPQKFQVDIKVDKAHSHILEWFVTTGMIGGVLYCVLLFLIGRRLFYSENKVWIMMFTLFVYHSQTNVISISEELIFWFLVGVALQSSGTIKKSQSLR